MAFQVVAFIYIYVLPYIYIYLSLASRKHCDFENAETLRIFPRPKDRCDFSGDFLVGIHVILNFAI